MLTEGLSPCESNPSNQQVYTPANVPTLLLGRGYTGHEHLTDFGLINMNGRLYDPVLGRFLSPDNYVQLPDFSQNFNRYSYCLNNPLRYNDKDGDWILELVLAIVGAYIGGVASNSGELNPGHWNYKAATTWLGMGVGAIIGYAGGCGLCPGTMNFGISISTPWVSGGVMAGSSAAGLGKGTDWKFNFHWTTAAGDGGTTEYSPSKLDEQVGQIFDDAVDKMNDYYQSYSDMITYSLDAAQKYAREFDSKFLKNTYYDLKYTNLLSEGKEIFTQPTWNRRARKAFEVVGKNAGEFIGGYTMGTISFSLAAETGYLAPMSPYVGYSGYIYGSYHGGREGEYYAGRLFDSMYSVYLVGRKLKKISDQSIFHQQMYNNNPSPYPF